eukprot:gene231-153_t
MSRRINDKFHELGKAKIELIRKACCHPRIFDPSLHLGRAGASASIDQVMIMKVEQTKVRCEEAQRDLLFYLFKLAGLRILQALHHRHVQLTPMQAFFASAAAIYHLALLTMQKHRLSTSSYALFQLVGDDAFDSSHLIWFPAVRLGMVHKKTLLGWKLAPVPLWKMEKFCREALLLHPADTVVVAFPAEMSLAASDFHDAFVTVLTRRVASPADYFVLPTVHAAPSSSPPSTQLMYQAKKTYRAKQWQLNVSQCHTMVLLARFATARTTAAGSEAMPEMPSTNKSIEFAWAHVDSLGQQAPLSSTALHLRLWSHVALEETLFDTDQLQELHVQHNFLYALQVVTSAAVVPAAVEEAVLHSVKSTQQLPTLCDEMSLLPPPPPPVSGATSDKINGSNDQQGCGMELTQSMQMAEQRKGLIETDYLGSAVDRRNVAWFKLQEATNKVTQLEAAILEHSDRRDWWTGFVPEYLAHYDLFWQEFDDTIDRSEEAYAKFRGVSHAMQWVHQLRQEFQELTRARQAAVRAMQPLQASPSMLEIAEAAQCQQCRAYFQRYGPVCTHCQRFNKVLQPYKQQHLTAARRRTTHVVSTATGASTNRGRSLSSTSKKTKNILGGVEQYYNDMPSLIDQGGGGSGSHNGGGGEGGALLTRQFEEGVVEGAYFMCLRLIRKHAHRALQLDAEASTGHTTTVAPQDICLLHATSSTASAATATGTSSGTAEAAAPSSVVGSGAIVHMKRPLTSSLTCHNAAGDEVETVDHPTASIPAFKQMLKRVKGRWGTKIDALIADILLIVSDPLRIDEKAIVFSQWSEMLEIVADALRMNQIPFTSCFNRQRDFEDQRYGVEAFRHDPHLRLLLLPLHLGAEGLDLVVASHVFLLEPLLNPSQEAQAINRIDRLGQRQRATYVHKYLLSDTIEERITLLQQ